MKKQFEAITKITEAIKDLNSHQAINVLNFVQSDVHTNMYGEGSTPVKAAEVEENKTEDVETPVVEEKPKKKRAPRKKAAPKAAEVVSLTMDEVKAKCVEVANKLQNGDKVKALIMEACGVPALKDAKPETYSKLMKLLGDA